MKTLPISCRILHHTHPSAFLSSTRSRAGFTKKPLFSFLSVGDKQPHFQGMLSLKKFLTLVREGKRKRDVRNVSVTAMGDSILPEKVENLHVTDGGSSQEVKRRDSKNPAATAWRRREHPGNVDKISASIFVDPPLVKFVNGKGGITREKIEKETGATLLIPRFKAAEAGTHVVLQGESQEALENAMQQVHEHIDQAIKSPQLPYSHFISIPLARYSKLLDSVVDFQKSVLGSGDSSKDGSGLKGKGIDESIFVKPATLHLTLLMLKLWNNDRVQAASDCLQRVMPRVHKALEGSPLTIKLAGVDCMNENYAKAHVLYAKVIPDDQAKRLVKASQVITEAFTKAGLVMEKDQLQDLKLHATLMNTSQRSKGGSGKSYSKRIPFDATGILTKFKNYKWGDYHISEAHLSQRFLYDKNGYYHCCSSIPLP